MSKHKRVTQRDCPTVSLLVPMPKIVELNFGFHEIDGSSFLICLYGNKIA
jgi:hypothetical protein